MAIDWDAEIAANQQKRAVANVAGANGVDPTRAVGAIRDAAGTGVPAAIAMHADAPELQPAATPDQQAILNTSPAVRSFVAQSPAHAAATSDDFGALAGVGRTAQSFAQTAGTDFFGPGIQAFHSLISDIKKAYDSSSAKEPSLLDMVPGFNPQDQKLGAVLADVAGLAFSPLSGALNTVARPLSYIPAYKPGTTQRATQPEAQANLVNMFGTALMGLGPEARIAGVRPGPIDEGTFGAKPRLTGAQEPVMDAEFEPIPTPGGNPVHTPVYSAIADLDAENVGRLQASVAESATHGRAPELLQQFLEDHTEAGGREVSVPADAIAKVWQQGHSLFEDKTAEIKAAMDTGTSVSVPLSQYVTETAGKPFLEQLNSASQFRENGVSQDEAKNLPEPVDITDQNAEIIPDNSNAPEGTAKQYTPHGEVYVVKPDTLDPAEVEAMLPTAEQYGGRYAMGRANTAFQFRTEAARDAFLEDIKGNPTVTAEPKPELALPEDLAEHADEVRTIAARAEGASERVFRETGLDQLFSEPKATGLTKGQFERYGERVDEARTAIHERLLERTYKQLRRERTPEWKAAIELHTEEAKALIEAQPNVQAYRAIKDSMFKLDTEQVAELYPELPLPKELTKKGGLSPDEAAELTGHASGADLVANLYHLHEAVSAVGGTLNDYVKVRAKAYAEAQSRALLGYDVTPQGLLDAAREAVQESPIENLLTQDLKDLAGQAGVPFDQKMIQAKAEALFAKLPVKEATKPKAFAENMRKLGNKAESSLMSESPVKAFVAKQQQYIQYLQMKEAFAFQKEYASSMKLMNTIAKKPIVAGMDQTARNQARAILARVGFTVRTGKYEGVVEALKGMSLTDYVNSLMARGYQPVFADIPNLKMEDMLVDQFRGVRDTVKSIAQLGRDDKRAFNQGKAQELSTIGQEVKANASAIGRPFTAGEMHRLKDTMKGNLGTGQRQLGAAVSRPETFLYWLDQEKNGPLMKYLVSELQDGKYYKTDMIQKIGKEFRDFVAKQPKGWQHSLEQAVDVPELTYSIGSDGKPIQWLMNRGNVVMMATHFGTESNFAKLTEGFGWDAQTVRAVADRVLTEADWKYVQHILDVNKALLPELQKLYRSTVGLAMKNIPATPIPTPFGTLSGGYRHISYDWNSIEENEKGEVLDDPNSLKASDLFGADYRVATPPNAYTLQRTNFSAPMNLDHAILHREIESVIHDIAYRPALIQATKIMRQPQVRQGVREALGPEYLTTINNWLKDIARGSSYDQTVLKGAARLIRGVRRRFTMVQIGYNVATLAKHGGIAAAHISGEVGIPEFAKASSDLLRDQDLQRWVTEQSGEVRGALMNLDRDVREIMQDLFRKQGFVDNYRYHAFTMFGKVKQIEATATWLAKYRTLTDRDGLAHEDAVALANKSVRDTQGAGGPVDLPALWRGGGDFWGEVGKLSNMFTGFENTSTNRMWTMLRRGGRGGGGPPGSPGRGKGYEDRGFAGQRRDFQKSFSDLLSYFVIPALYASAFDLVSGGKLHKGVKGGALFLEHFLENSIKGALGGSLPLGNMLADVPRLIASRGKDFGSGGPLQEMLGSAVGTAVNAWDALHKKDRHKIEDRWPQHAMETAGYMFNLPVKPVSKGGQFLWDKAQGHVKDKSMLEFFRGLIFGSSTDEAKKPR